MKTLAFIRPVVIAACLACLSSSAAAQTDPSAAGNVSGAVSIASGAIAMSRGVFSIPAPFTVPNEEGDLLFNIFPTYSPDSGLSEWGMGWRSAITITRWRPDRRIDFSDSDRFVSPWGPLVKSPADDFWYPEGITQLVRVEFVPAPVGDTISKFIAYLPDGRIATFTDYKYARLFGTTGVELESRFEWSLESVRDALGRTMNVGYRVVDGRRLIDTVEYGGLGENHPYKIKINYGAADPASNTAIATFRGGYQERFSRRVTSIDCFSHATDQPRWSYLLEHDNNATNPAVFYLRSVTKVFRSGARQPPIRYHYRVHGEELASARAAVERAHGISARTRHQSGATVAASRSARPRRHLL